jgi:hypothetical protein
MTNGIKGDTVDEFVNNVPNDKTTEESLTYVRN